MLKVKDKPFLEWWVKDCLDIGYADYRGNYVYDREDVGMAVFITIVAFILALVGAFILLAIVLATKGIALVVLSIIGGSVWAVWKAIDGVLGDKS